MTFSKMAYAAYAGGIVTTPASYESAINRQPIPFWNAWANDKEAFNLSVTASISIRHCGNCVICRSPSGVEKRVMLKVGGLELSRAEATRQAIVDCAALIGEATYIAETSKAEREAEKVRTTILPAGTPIEVPVEKPPIIKWQVLTTHGTYVTVRADEEPTEVDGLLAFRRGGSLVAKFRSYNHIERQN